MDFYCPNCTTNGKRSEEMSTLPYGLFRCPQCGLMQKMTLHPSGPWTIEDISPTEAQQEMRNRQLEKLQRIQKQGEDGRKQEQENIAKRKVLAEKQRVKRSLSNACGLLILLVIAIGYLAFLR